MSVGFYQSNHFFENRLYLTRDEVSTDKLAELVHHGGREHKGFGFRSYSSFIGKILSKFGVATELHYGNQTFYFNNKSLSETVIRVLELKRECAYEGINFTNLNPKELMEKVDRIYAKHLNEGYNENQVRAVNNLLKLHAARNQGKIQNFWDIFNKLEVEAVEEEKTKNKS